MSTEISGRVWRSAKQKGGKLLLLLALADQANKKGYCWPSVGTLAEMTRMSERHVSRMCQAAAEDGDLYIHYRPGRSNQFVVLVEMGEFDFIEVATEHLKMTSAEAHEAWENRQNPRQNVTPPAGENGTPDKMSPPEISLVTPDKMSPPQNVTPDKAMSPTPDKAMSPDPLIPINNNNDEPELDLSLLWADAQNELRLQMLRQTYDLWLAQARVVRLEDSIVVIQVPTQMAADWINGRLADTVSRTLANLSGRELSVYATVATLHSKETVVKVNGKAAIPAGGMRA